VSKSARVWLVVLLSPFVLLGILELRHALRWRRIEAGTSTIAPGMTRGQVVAKIGTPEDTMGTAPSGRLFYFYRPRQPIPLLREPSATVEFSHDVVTRVTIYPDAEIRFDAADWKASYADRRGCMAMDLLSKVDFAGMPRGGIIDLLGPPDRERDGAFSYRLGNRIGMDMDEDRLTIDFDKSGAASSARLTK